jgi:peptidoglycan hydrolase CwlO-like protein
VPRTAARIGASPAGAATSAGTDAGTGVETVLAALREAHNSELARLTEAVTAERARADALRDQITALQGKLTTAQERIDAVDRAEAARQGRGRWARLRAAWRGG